MKTKTFLAACLITAAGLTGASAETVTVADVKMLAKAGQVKEAVEQLKEVRRIDPDNAQAKKIEKAIGHVGP